MMDELHDIKPLEPIFGMPWWGWALLALLVVKVAVLIALLRRRKKPAPVLTPLQRARLELDALAAPADDASALEFQTRLAALLRAWVEARFAIAATDMTREELARDLTLGRALGAQLRGEFLDLLALADETRFARAAVSLQRHATARARAQRFIAATTPVDPGARTGPPSGSAPEARPHPQAGAPPLALEGPPGSAAGAPPVVPEGPPDPGAGAPPGATS